MKSLALLLLPCLAGCTMSAAGLAKTRVKMTVPSEKPSQVVATCAAETLIGNIQLRNDGDHYWLLRLNMAGVPVSRWDFLPSASGSVAELRSTIDISAGTDKVKACS